MVDVCLRNGKEPICKHWSPDYIGFKCHGYNNLMQKCTGYEPKKEEHNNIIKAWHAVNEMLKREGKQE